MSSIERIAVVGLGLVGGSVARDAAALGAAVMGYDPDEAALRQAVDEKIITTAMDPSLEDIRDADVVVLAAPVDAVPALLCRIAPLAANARLITDVGSTKTRIVGAAAEAGIGDRFVGAHPMAGDHRSGWAASRAGLFAGALVYLCPTGATRPDVLAHAEVWWRRLGARSCCTPAEEHDRIVAWTSHLPHLLSASLAAALRDAGLPRDALGPGGRDATRLARGSPELWSAIALENAPAIHAALEQAEREIAALRTAVASGDRELVRRRLAAAQSWAAAGAPASLPAQVEGL